MEDNSMTGEQRLVATIALAILSTIVAIVISSQWSDAYVRRAHIDAGHEQVMEPSVSECVWRKAK